MLDISDHINKINKLYNTLQKIGDKNFYLEGQKLQAVQNMRVEIINKDMNSKEVIIVPNGSVYL